MLIALDHLYMYELCHPTVKDDASTKKMPANSLRSQPLPSLFVAISSTSTVLRTAGYRYSLY